ASVLANWRPIDSSLWHNGSKLSHHRATSERAWTWRLTIGKEANERAQAGCADHKSASTRRPLANSTTRGLDSTSMVFQQSEINSDKHLRNRACKLIIFVNKVVYGNCLCFRIR